MSTSSLRAAAALLLTVPLLLAGCSTAVQPPAVPGGDQPIPTEPDLPTGPGADELDYPFGVDTAWLDALDADRAELAAASGDWYASCTVSQAVDPAHPCDIALLELLKSVNGLKGQWFAYDDSDWQSGEHSGLEALAPTRAATATASQSGSDWADLCTYVAGNEECPDLAESFLLDLDALNQTFAEWQR